MKLKLQFLSCANHISKHLRTRQVSGHYKEKCIKKNFFPFAEHPIGQLVLF